MLLLAARGPIFATIAGLYFVVLQGYFWLSAKQTNVNCRGQERTVAACAGSILNTAVAAVLCVASINLLALAVILPSPKIRRAEDEIHHWLSPEFSHIGYTRPDERGYQHILYLNHPTTPSKIRFNMADSGTHASEMVIRDTEDLSLWPKRQQGEDQNWFVDVSRDDEMPPLYNDFTQPDALSLANTLTSHIIDYLSSNNLNGSCFLTQYLSSAGGLRQGIIKVVPSTTGNDDNFPALDCGTDPEAFNISIPLY